MANIPTWRSVVLMEGTPTDVLAVLTQASTPYPTIVWANETTLASQQKIVTKRVVMETPTFAFWNFVHPTSAEIYKYYPRNNAKTSRRKWNRDNWGSAYDADTFRAVVVGEAIADLTTRQRFDIYHNNITTRSMQGLKEKVQALKDESKESVAVYLSLDTEDCPSKIWGVIARQHPSIKFTATVMCTSYNEPNTLRVWEAENGQAMFVGEIENYSSHAGYETLLGKCTCTFTGEDVIPVSWHEVPQECRDKYFANVEAEVQKVVEQFVTTGAVTYNPSQIRQLQFNQHSDTGVKYADKLQEAYIWARATNTVA
jgi:hypothetical protein